MSEIKGRTFDLLTLGQVLLRLSPPDNDRLSRGDTFVTVSYTHLTLPTTPYV